MLTVGSAITYVDEHSYPHDALITCLHNGKTELDETDEQDRKACINVVYVSSDEDKRDPNGRQIERASSVQGKSEYTAHGRFWIPV